MYAVERLNWRRYGTGWARLPGTTRLQSFPTWEEAEADRRRREAVARAQVNPFLCGGPALHYQTGLDDDRLHDWLRDAGLAPPKPGKKGRDWAGWWQKAQRRMTALQREKVWEALDKVRFFEVVESPRRPVIYVLATINWAWNGEWLLAESEGGLSNAAFIDRRAALEACAQANDHYRDHFRSTGAGEVGFDLSWRRAYQGDPLTTTPPARQEQLEGLLEDEEEVPFAEPLEVELAGEVPGPGGPSRKRVYLVQRLSWFLGEVEGRPNCERAEDDNGVPVRAFLGRGRAESFCRGLERQARRELTPFQFAPAYPGPEATRALAGLGLRPPTAQEFPRRGARDQIDWWAWWDAVAAELSDGQREGLWDVLASTHLYEVAMFDWG
ncbi:MAG TPA: hypothetical protein VFE78_22590, partial [Gemmataceae bacterium]|nr:hypothetical protein [Gemmataceae bacterium]